MTLSQQSARVAALARHRPADDPELIDARTQLKGDSLAEHVRRAVESAPPLTAAQRDRITQILHGVPTAPVGGGAR